MEVSGALDCHCTWGTRRGGSEPDGPPRGDDHNAVRRERESGSFAGEDTPEGNAAEAAAGNTGSPPSRAPARPSVPAAATRAGPEARTPMKPRPHGNVHLEDARRRGFPWFQ